MQRSNFRFMIPGTNLNLLKIHFFLFCHKSGCPDCHSCPVSPFASQSTRTVPNGVDYFLWFQFSSVAQSCMTLWDPMNCSMPGLPVHHQLLEPTQTHVYWVDDAIQPSHPLLPPSPAFHLSQKQGLFQWVGCLYQVAKVLDLQLQPQSIQWIFRIDFL